MGVIDLVLQHEYALRVPTLGHGFCHRGQALYLFILRVSDEFSCGV